MWGCFFSICYKLDHKGCAYYHIILLFFYQELDYKEFKMFAMACIDKQKELDEKKKEKLLKGMSEECGGDNEND